MLTDYEKGFVEGVIDTDGCITIYKHRHKASRGWHAKVLLSVSNCNDNLLKKFQNIVGGGTIIKKPNKTGGIYEYRLQQYGENGCKKLFPQITLIVKEERRLYAFKIWKHIEGSSLNRNRGVTYEKKLEQLMANMPSASKKTT